MTLDRDKIIEAMAEAALNVLRKDRGLPPAKISDLTKSDRRHWINEAEAGLRALCKELPVIEPTYRENGVVEFPATGMPNYSGFDDPIVNVYRQLKAWGECMESGAQEKAPSPGYRRSGWSDAKHAIEEAEKC